MNRILDPGPKAHTHLLDRLSWVHIEGLRSLGYL
jgi:hypothetical protein